MSRELLPDKDKDIALESIIFGLTILSLEKDILVMKQSKLILKEQHVQFMETLLEQVIKDAARNKKDMYRNGIKVFDRENINEDFVSYRYVVRGFESEFRFFRSALKMHTSKKIEGYYSKLLNPDSSNM